MAKRRREEEDGSIIMMSMDRISELPEPILHHILCFLSQEDAVKTCVLSKSWRYLWSTRPKIEFRENGYRGIGPRVFMADSIKRNKETFLSALDKTLQGYHDQKLCIQEFVVWISRTAYEYASLVKKWIPIVILNMGVKKFELSFFSEILPYFDLPSVVFEAESLLENLSLRGCRLSQNSIETKHLRTLHFYRVYVVEKTLDKILSNCPLIEDVSLCGCKGFRSIELSNNKPQNLKRFVFQNRYNDKITGCLFPRHNYLYFSHLTHLVLARVRLPDLFLCNFPCLDELELETCYGIKELNLLSRSMEVLIIRDMKEKPFKATIDAPSIAGFLYEGAAIPQSISFAAAANHVWRSKILLTSCPNIDKNASLWFHKLNELLKALSQSKISLQLGEEKQIHIEDPDPVDEDSTNIVVGDKPVVVEHLKLMSREQLSLSFPDFLNCLFRICRPRYIGKYRRHACSGTDIQFIQFLREILLKERVCQHVLEQVSMEVWDRNVKGWRPVPSGCNQDHDDALAVRFPLKWRESNRSLI